MKRKNFRDKPCFYATVINAGKTALLAGPFENESDCRQWAYSDEEDGGNIVKHHLLYQETCRVDCRAHWYSWGMVKMPNGHRDGIISKVIERKFGIDIRDITDELIIKNRI